MKYTDHLHAGVSKQVMDFVEMHFNHVSSSFFHLTAVTGSKLPLAEAEAQP